MDKQTVIDAIIEREGGYVNDPLDSGGETMYGVTVKVAKECGYIGAMRSMPRWVAFDVYVTRYWDAVRADSLLDLSAPIADEVVDTAVNMGVNRASVFLQRALNVFNKRGALYADVTIDGNIGPATLTALRDYLAVRTPDVLLDALNCLQGSHYITLSEKRKKDEAFVYGWFKQRVTL